MNLGRLASAALIVVLATSLWFGVKLGSTPVMKLALFLLGLTIWYGLLTFVRELLTSEKGKNGSRT